MYPSLFYIVLQIEIGLTVSNVISACGLLVALKVFFMSHTVFTSMNLLTSPLQTKYHTKTHSVFFSLRKNFPIHFIHDLSADIKTESISRFICDIAATVKAVEQMWQLQIRHHCSRVEYPNHLTIVLLVEINCDRPPITVLESIFQQILHDLKGTFHISLQKPVFVVADEQLRQDHVRLWLIDIPDLLNKVFQIKL